MEVGRTRSRRGKQQQGKPEVQYALGWTDI